MTEIKQGNKLHPIAQSSLETMIEGCARGDSGALSELYEAVSTPVYAFALSILKNRQDAEDVLHDCFINIWEASGRYESCGRPMAWIMTITRNLAMNLIKQHSRFSESPGENLQDCLSRESGMSPEDVFVVRACMERLSDEERKILVLHAVSGFKHREIAAFMKLPLATVLSKHARAIKKLRTILEKENFR